MCLSRVRWILKAFLLMCNFALPVDEDFRHESLKGNFIIMANRLNCLHGAKGATILPSSCEIAQL